MIKRNPQLSPTVLAALAANGLTGDAVQPGAVAGATGATGAAAPAASEEDTTGATGATGAAPQAGETGATGAGDTGAAPADAGETGAAPQAADTVVAAISPDLAAHLRTELAELRAANATLTTANASLTATNTTLEAHQSALLSVVDTAVQRLAVPMNASLAGYSSMNAESKVAFWNELNASFLKKFKVGASTTAGTADDEHDADGKVIPISGRQAATARATSLSTNSKR